MKVFRVNSGMHLNKHEVSTVRDEGWLGKKNGVLLELMAKAGFEIFVTVDQNLQHQQNLENFPISIYVLRAVNNRLMTLAALIPQVLLKIDEGRLHKINQIS